MTYQKEYNRSIEEPENFWREKAGMIDWFTFPELILGRDDNDNDRWFGDGELNTAYLALDYHVDHGRAKQTALIYERNAKR